MENVETAVVPMSDTSVLMNSVKLVRMFDAAFRTSGGEVDLMKMSQTDPNTFRAYISASRLLRQVKRIV
jgi:hypothetical protein